jgi:hypothetical protein
VPPVDKPGQRDLAAKELSKVVLPPVWCGLGGGGVS